MNQESANQTVRDCLKAVKPALVLEDLRDDEALLETRIITSLDILDLIVHLEHASGRPITPAQLQPGSFRDVKTIARVFLLQERAQ